MGGLVGCSVKSDQIFKIRHSLTFSTIIPPTVPCHPPLLNGIQGHQKEDKLFSGIFQIIRQPRGVPVINFTIVCKRFCPLFVNLDSGENGGVIPSEMSEINQKCLKLNRNVPN